jgi:hypothetical protein
VSRGPSPPLSGIPLVKRSADPDRPEQRGKQWGRERATAAAISAVKASSHRPPKQWRTREQHEVEAAVRCLVRFGCRLLAFEHPSAEPETAEQSQMSAPVTTCPVASTAS